MNEKVNGLTNRSRLMLSLVLSICFIMDGVFLISIANDYPDHRFQLLRNPLTFQIVGALTIIFFSYTAKHAITKLLDKNK